MVIFDGVDNIFCYYLIKYELLVNEFDKEYIDVILKEFFLLMVIFMEIGMI